MYTYQWMQSGSGVAIIRSPVNSTNPRDKIERRCRFLMSPSMLCSWSYNPLYYSIDGTNIFMFYSFIPLWSCSVDLWIQYIAHQYLLLYIHIHITHDWNSVWLNLSVPIFSLALGHFSFFEMTHYCQAAVGISGAPVIIISLCNITHDPSLIQKAAFSCCVLLFVRSQVLYFIFLLASLRFYLFHEIEFWKPPRNGIWASCLSVFLPSVTPCWTCRVACRNSISWCYRESLHARSIFPSKLQRSPMENRMCVRLSFGQCATAASRIRSWQVAAIKLQQADHGKRRYVAKYPHHHCWYVLHDDQQIVESSISGKQSICSEAAAIC